MTVSLINVPDHVFKAPLVHGFSQEFRGLGPRQQAQYLLSDLGAGADLSETIVFSSARRILIHDVLITPDGSSVSVDANNDSVWTVKDNGGNTIVTQTYDESTTFPADGVQTSLGTIAFGSIAAGGHVTLTVTNDSAANLPPVVVTIVYTDLEALLEGWEIIATDEGTFGMSDGVDGGLSLRPSDGTAGDNDEIYLARQYERFKIAANKPILLRAMIDFDEANTDDANVLVGLMDAVAANALQDNGAGPPSSYSGAVFFKEDGQTKWSCESSDSTTQTTQRSTVTAGGNLQTLEIEIVPISSDECDVYFRIDSAGGNNLLDLRENGANPRTPDIKHTFDYSNATEMQVVFGAKNGDTNNENLKIIRVDAYQKR